MYLIFLYSLRERCISPRCTHSVLRTTSKLLDSVFISLTLVFLFYGVVYLLAHALFCSVVCLLAVVSFVIRCTRQLV
jgi:hypothetical protein